MNSRYTLKSAPRPSLHELGFVRDVAQRLTFIVIALVLINLITMRYRVEGPSMEAGLEDGQVLVLNRLAYAFAPPTRGDIVVFHMDSLSSKDLIKRVIGLPGETIEIRENQVYVNGTALELTWGQDCSDCEPGLWTLGLDEYFVMGDHRAASRDSRMFGPVRAETMLGKVIWRYWPLDHFGPVS